MTAVVHRLSSPVTLTRSPLATVETVLMSVLILLFAQALLGPLLVPDQDPEGSPILRLMWLPVYGVIALGAAVHWRGMLAAALAVPVQLALLVFVMASIIWSTDPSLSFRRAVAVVMTTGFGLLLAARYDWRDFLTLTGGSMLVLALASLLTCLLVPSFGVAQGEIHYGAWKGLWYEKNTLGAHMARASLVFGFLAMVDRQRRWVWAGGLGLAAFLVLMSTSKTSLLGMLLGLGVLTLGALIKRGAVSAAVWIWAASVVGIALVAGIVFAPDVFLGLIGRDASLTGRTDIWSALERAIAERPWLGYGYGAFWAPDSAAAQMVRDAVRWDAPTAHNGWLETWLSVGVVGVGLFAISFVSSSIRALWQFTQSWQGLYVLGFLAQFALFSFSESDVLQQNAITWVSYVAVTAIMGRRKVAAAAPLSGPAGLRRGFRLPEPV